MSKRVYEIAREKSLDSKEVIKRLREAGVEVNHHSATIEDPVYERVFGDGQNGQPNAEATPTEPAGATVEDAQNGRPEASAVSTPGAPVEPQEPVTEARRSGRKRRRVVIDASATNRGASRTAATPAAAREEPKAAPVEEPVGETANKTAVRIEPGATVKDLADALGVAPAQVVKVLFSLGEMKTVTQTLSTDEIELVAAEMGVEVEIGAIEEPALEEVLPEDAAEDLVEKPPVVTVMGHVDHGKTSLLDRIRQANVQSGEAGGITQHIGAYQVESGGKKITFIDTPGHEAFTEMRARGARVTDVVILVVAADDGVMPQTDEAIEHARAARVPMVVALNKIDVPNASPDRVYAELSERELVPEVYGGDTVTVPVSAKTGEGIDELLENVLIVAELEDLKANPHAPASGYVIESERDPGRGPVATLLVNRGTLHKGDVVLAGTAYGRVRAMLNYTGQRIKEAGPGDPVEILGLSGVPEAGTRFEATDHERNARDKAHQAEAALRRQELAEGGPRRTLEELLGEGGVQDLNLVVKADVAGSVEALKEALARLSTDEVRVNIVRSGVGAVTDSDVMLGSASGGIVLGFNVRPTNTAKQVAERGVWRSGPTT
ncbi:MAG: translation initiation factor IF-2 [Actinomycetota bacterium]|nr:translation initiation factor IF-2 [Actinomycetota bacterium]